ncbi:MAG: M50 family metallopeptidase [Pyrinomonadaceae bacterium]
MPINYTLAADTRPQVRLLIIASLASVGIWIVSLVVPGVSYLVYPLQLFATFVHEGSHALAAFVTGSPVLSMTVSPDTSGMVWSQTSGLAGLLVSSAGYMGTTAFGTLLLVWMRYSFSSRLALYFSAGFVAVMTLLFGFVAPFWNFLTNVTFLSVVFTVFSGAVLTAILAAVAKFGSLKWINFSLAFLAVQCLLNALFSLKTLLFASASGQASDAANMAAATGVPAVVWVVLWIAVSLAMIMTGVRLYATSRSRIATDTVFLES